MNRLVCTLVIAISAIIFTSTPSFAIITRHDISLDAYQQFALDPLFNSVGSIVVGNKGCTGTLIDERTVLTAAHCLEGTDSFVSFRLANENLTFLTGSYRGIGKRLPNPNNNMLGYGLERVHSDLALLYLDYPLAGLDYPEIANDFAAPDVITGWDAFMAGFGEIGQGHHRIGFPNTQKLKLAGMTQLIAPKIQGDLFALRTLFLPDLPYSANSGRGDSGGPLFIRHPTTQKYVIVGVSSQMEMEDYLNSDQNWLDTACFMKGQGFIDDLAYSMCKLANPEVVKGYGFRGYFTSSYFTYVNHFASFINEGKAVVYAVSSLGIDHFPHNWSNVREWAFSSGKTNFQPSRVDNATSNDQFGNLFTHFNVKVDGTLVADGNYRVDSLLFDKPAAKLVILPNATISSIRTKAQAGRIVVDGSLETQRLVLEQSELSGNGTIAITPTPYPKRVIHEKGVLETVVNENGHINLGEGRNILTITGGGLRQGPQAKLSVPLHSSGGSSLLSVDKTVVLNGTLTIKIVDPNKSMAKKQRMFVSNSPSYRLQFGFGGWADSHGALVGFGALNSVFAGGPMIGFEQPEAKKEYRWTILRTKEKILGDFNNVEFMDSENVAGKMRLERYPDRIDVVIDMQ